MFSTGPGPEDSAHLWGDYHYEDSQEEALVARAPKSQPWPDHGLCGGLRVYPTQADADAGAKLIAAWCANTGRVYLPLRPVRCPEGDHWHLGWE